MTETFAARHDRGRGIPSFPPLPYFPEAALKALAGTDAIVCVGVREPVAVFAVPGLPSQLAPDGATRVVLGPGREGEILQALAEDACGRSRLDSSEVQPAPAPTWDQGALVDAMSLGAVVAAQLTEGSVVIEEAATNGHGYSRVAASGEPHVSLGLTGGAIGMGLPLAVGAAVARPGAEVAAAGGRQRDVHEPGAVDHGP